MRVEVSRSGGFAGITRRAAVRFSVRGGSAPGDAEWAALYQAAVAQSRTLAPEAGRPGAERSTSAAVRDSFQWTLRLGTRTLKLSEHALDGPLRELAERVLREGD